MPWNNKNIDMTWFVGGMLALAYAGFVMVTGKFLFHEDYRSLFLDQPADPIDYYLNLIISIILGVVALYRSLLFIPSNRKYHDEHPEYLRRRMALQRADVSVNLDRLSNVILGILFIFAVIIIVLKFI